MISLRRGSYFMAQLICALLLAGCAGDAKEKSTSELIHIAMTGDGAGDFKITHFSAVEELVRRAIEEEDRAAVQGLIWALERYDLAKAAAETLAVLGTKEAVEPLLLRLGTYKGNESIYYKATPKQYVITLSKIRDDKAVDILIAELTSPDPARRTLGLTKAALIASFSQERVPSRINSIPNYKSDT